MSSQLSQKGLGNQKKSMLMIAEGLKESARTIAKAMVATGQSCEPIKTPSGGVLAFVTTQKDLLSPCLFTFDCNGQTFYIGNKSS